VARDDVACGDVTADLSTQNGPEPAADTCADTMTSGESYKPSELHMHITRE